jgi:hypothetical protein
MKQVFILLLTCLALCAYSQKSNLPATITGERTGAHINIPGTRLYIIPPQGFTVSSSLPAIEKGNDAIIQAMDLVGGSFYSNAATFTKTSFQQMGITVFDFRELTVNGYPAKMALMQGDPTAKVYNLVFGDSTFSIMITAIFPSNDNAVKEQVEKALASIYYDKTKQVDPFATAPFKLDDSQSVFKFANFTASIYVYSVNGVKKSSYDDDPYLMVISLPAEGVTPEGAANSMLSSIQKYGMVIKDMKNVSTGSTNNFAAYQREVYCKINDADALVFQHVVTIGSSLIVMQGIARSNYENTLQEFKKLTGTIAKK